VADSESNIIRAIDSHGGQCRLSLVVICLSLATSTVPATTCGCNIRLVCSAFGDKILIADTYNHKIKELDPKRRRVVSVSVQASRARQTVLHLRSMNRADLPSQTENSTSLIPTITRFGSSI
jgi:hypothetical protein